MDPHRTERVSEALREELGEMIAYELSDPRVVEATVTEVLVTPGMKHAQVRLHFADPQRLQRGNNRCSQWRKTLFAEEVAESV